MLWIYKSVESFRTGALCLSALHQNMPFPGFFHPLLLTVSVRLLTDLVHKTGKNNAVNLPFKVYELKKLTKRHKQYKHHQNEKVSLKCNESIQKI